MAYTHSYTTTSTKDKVVINSTLKALAKVLLALSVSGSISALVILSFVKMELIVDSSETRAIAYAIDGAGNISTLALAAGLSAFLFVLITDSGTGYRYLAVASCLLALAETIYVVAFLTD